MLSEIFTWGTECKPIVLQNLWINVEELFSYCVTAAREICYAVKALLAQ